LAPRYASSDGLRVRQFDLDEGNHVRIACQIPRVAAETDQRQQIRDLRSEPTKD
jgi:hypothetical protein